MEGALVSDTVLDAEGDIAQAVLLAAVLLDIFIQILCIIPSAPPVYASYLALSFACHSHPERKEKEKMKMKVCHRENWFAKFLDDE